MTKIMGSLFLVLSLFMNNAFAGYGNVPHPQADPVFNAEEIDHDIEELLLTKEELKSKIQEDNETLLMTALKYNYREAIYSLMVSGVITFFFAKEPLKLIPLYLTNGTRILNGLRKGEALGEIKMVEDSTKISVGGIALGVGASFTYLGTRWYLKGICLFSCLDAFASRITDRQEQEFLMSPTYKKIKSEIGENAALKFVTLLKQIRASSYTNEDPFKMMVHFVEAVGKVKVKSLEDFNFTAAPTFTALVKILNENYKLDAIVFSYLLETGQRQST